MSWTTPRTFVAAELLTASIFNTHLRDNLNALRDYLLGAQDLGSDWKITTGRALTFTDPDVAHGMTTVLPTDTWGAIQIVSGTQGGMLFTGVSDADQKGLQVWGVNGSATPTAAGLLVIASKKNGTGAQAFSGITEPAMQFYNHTTLMATMDSTGWSYVGKGSYSGNVFAASFLVTGATGTSITGVLNLLERADPANAGTNEAYVYARDNGAGKTQVVARFQSGAAVVMATEP